MVRGSMEYLPTVSTWATDSVLGRQFPVLNSSAADAVIGLVMKEFKNDSCAIGFGQWQQSHVSGSTLSLPWSVPVDTDQNPVVFKDILPADGAILLDNPNRHKLVLCPVTWLSMGLDVRSSNSAPSSIPPLPRCSHQPPPSRKNSHAGRAPAGVAKFSR